MRARVVVAMLVGCSSPPEPARPGAPTHSASCGQPIVGTQADYVPPAVPPTIVVSAPKLCGDAAYIRIERASGGRRLGTARGSGGGFNEGCMTLPAHAGDPAECATLNFAAILHQASADLQARHVDGAGGAGLGPCGNAQGDYDAWNMAVGVRAWRDAADAVKTVATLMETYNVAGHVGVSVRGIPCVTAE